MYLKKRSGFRYNASILLRLLKFALPYKGTVLLNALFLALTTLFMFVQPWFLGKAVDAAARGGGIPFLDQFAPPGTLWLLVIAAVGLVLAGALRGLCAFGQTYLGQSISQRVAYDIRNTLYQSLQRQSFAFYDRMQTAQLMSRATADVESARMLISWGLPRPLQTVVFFIGILVILWLTNWHLAAIALMGVPFIAYRAVGMSIRLRPIWLSIQQTLARLTVVLQESLSAAKLVRSFGRQDLEQAKFHARAKEVYDQELSANALQAFNTPIMTLIVHLILGAGLLYGGYEIMHDRLTVGELTQALFYMTMLSEQVRMIGFMGNLFSRAVASGERLFEILDAVPDVRDKPEAIPLEGTKGVVRLEDVSFSYSSLFPTLRRVNLEAHPGQVIALVGATGSGKSSLVSLIPRFYDVTEGRITVDGVDIRDITLDSLRRNIGIVQQDVFLFSATIGENIAYGRPGASQEDVVQVAKAARLHDFIVTLPDGYDTWVGERGITLSGGQKQRMAIARTLLLDPRILVLDDSLSSVDTETEYLIQQALKELMRGRTTFVIAQRLAGLKRADVILVLDRGEIVERGTHQELLERDGLYREIYDLQLRHQEEALEAMRSTVTAED